MRRKQTMWMMIAAMTALAGLTACSSDDGALGADATGQGVEIRLASSVGDGEDYATRSNTATNLQSGDTCYVWADMVNATTGVQTKYFDAWALKANGAGGLTTLASGNAKLFPATNALNFYAIVGNFGTKTVSTQQVPKITDGETEVPVGGILHTVLDDQSTATNYYKSDLLYAVKKNQEPISEAVVLPFKHLLSRIQVVLVAGNGINATDLATNTQIVELLDVKRQVMFKPDTTKSWNAEATRITMLPIPVDAYHGNIKMAVSAVSTSSEATAPGSTAYADAIIVPQTFTANKQLIHVRYLERDTYYTVPTGGLTFESGKQYRFRLICDRIGETWEFTGLTVETWGTNTDEAAWLNTIEGETNL